jgi:hypothetical protein
MRSINIEPADARRMREVTKLKPQEVALFMLAFAALAIMLVSVPAIANGSSPEQSIGVLPHGIPLAGKGGSAPAEPADCGLVWRVVPSPNGGTDFNGLQDVAIVSANDVWAIGYYTLLDGLRHRTRAMAQHWDGTAWSLVTVPLPGSESVLYSISSLSSANVWAVGTYTDPAINGDQTYTVHWDGSTWTQVPSPNFQTTSFLQGVAAVAPDAVWAVGGSYNASSSTASTLVLFWDGNSWAAVSSPNPGPRNYLMSATANSVDDLWAAGTTWSNDPQNQPSRTLTLHCARSGCSTVASPNTGIGDNQLYSVASLSPSEVWAVGASVVMTQPYPVAVPLALQWSGVGWTVLPTPPLPDGFDTGVFHKVIPVSPTAVWALGEAYSQLTYVDQTYAELWNGSSWTTVSPLNVSSDDSFIGGAAYSANDLWAVGTNVTGNTMQTLVERHSDPCVTPSPTPTNIPNPSPTSTPSSCSIQFTDVPVGSTFYSYVHCLACQNILGGYTSGCPTGNPCFKPGNPVTRGQLAKIVSNAAGYNDQHSDQTFQDVPVGSPFYDFVERLASRSITGGYACGGAGEPCVPPANLPYFRPNAQVTRGQTSKIVAIAASLPAPPSRQQTFQDVPVGSTFWQWIESLATAGTIGGYPCGGVGEPCVPPQNRPYFRPNNNVTRGQAAKIVSNTFFPNCQSHMQK